MSSHSDSSANPKKSYAIRKVRWVGHFNSTHQVVEETQRKGKSFDNEGKSYTLFVSPIHEAHNETLYPHQCVMIYSKKAAITKGQAKSAICDILGIQLTNDFIIDPLQIEPIRYIRQAWNPSILSKSEPEQIIKDCINVLESEKLIVTSKNLKGRLRENHGAHFMNRHKSLVDMIMKSPEYFTNKVTVLEPIDHEENFTNGAKVVATFARILDCALETKGYKTIHSKFKNLPNSDMTLAIIMIAILPTVAKRKEIPDNLPALYFYGNAGTGKSYFFNLHPAYHKVATDASGVSRYRLQVNEDAFLLDDITSDTLNDRINSSTIRNLALGGTATVKTMGDTEEVRGFVVCTSNDTPDFLAEEVVEDSNIEANYNAWRRRFITVNFTSTVNEDLIHVRFDHTSATDALKCFFVLCYNLLQVPDVKVMLSKYYVAIMDSLSPYCIEQFRATKHDLPNFMKNMNFKTPEYPSKKFKNEENYLSKTSKHVNFNLTPTVIYEPDDIAQDLQECRKNNFMQKKSRLYAKKSKCGSYGKTSFSNIVCKSSH